VLLTLTDGSSLSLLADRVTDLGGRVVQSLGVAASLLVELPQGVGAPAGSAEVPDVAMRVNGTQTYYDVDEPSYRETIGLDPNVADPADALGEGVRVALVDTGVADVPDLSDVEHINVTDAPQGDGFGHGTFLAGIIAGNGEFDGVAPAADLLDVQVADSKGNTSLSQVLAGLQVISDRNDPATDPADDVDVVNLSLSTESPLPPAFDPLSRALQGLWESGVTVVVAAGNDGPGWGTVSSPGNDPMLITVGALDEAANGDRDNDAVAEFSSRGSLYDVDKPDLVAPGVSLVATAAPDSIVVQRNRNALVGDGYMRGSGTSMAAAVVAGSVAAVLGENGLLEPNGVKALLKASTYSNGDLELADGAGTGGLDLSAALDAATADGVQLDPAQDEPKVPASEFGPSEDDFEAWVDFARAWEESFASDDMTAVSDAWQALSPRTRIWAARAWSMAVVANSLALDSADFEARAWSARAWSAEEWLARAWSARAWSARAWSDEEWLARAWSARAWSDDEWLARAWSARAWSGSDWAARAWSARAWSARAWSARAWSDDEWLARAWSARAWSARAWSARAWSARAWSDYLWEARAWSARAWSMDTSTSV
jgi:serine protease AprX